MIVKKCEVVKVEAIVRGYITGQWESEIQELSADIAQDQLGQSTRRARLYMAYLCQRVWSKARNCQKLSLHLRQRRTKGSMMRIYILIRVSCYLPPLARGL